MAQCECQWCELHRDAADLANGYITAAIPVTGEGPVAIHAEAVDAQGNVDVADADVTVTVDTVPADLIGAITIPEDLNGDGILNADELGTDGSFNAQVALGPMRLTAQCECKVTTP
ncbi:hypothetical protein ACINIS235_3062 [Acinetobacter baumannii IS-235]|nr:hypothetical protein ACINIS235_3062 [Acinetobacter baumannii IS-235]